MRNPPCSCTIAPAPCADDCSCAWPTSSAGCLCCVAYAHNKPRTAQLIVNTMKRAAVSKSQNKRIRELMK